MAASTASRLAPGPVSIGLPANRPVLLVAGALLGAFLVSFDTRLFAVGLPDLRGAFGLGVDEASWLATAATAPQILIAPAIAWLVTVYGAHRVLTGPSMLYALVSVVIPLVRDYPTLIALHLVHGLLLGAFIPATISIIFRNLPTRWWIVGITIYAFRQAFSLNVGDWIVGFHVQQAGWAWLYWQGALVGPLMGLLVWLGTPDEPVNRQLLASADWGGMMLLGAGVALIYAGMDQGNRLDWFQSGTVTALLAGGAALLAGFLLNEALVREPWAHASAILTRNAGIGLVLVVAYATTSLSNAQLVPGFLAGVAQMRPEQIGRLLLPWTALPLLAIMPLAAWASRLVDVRYLLVAGLACFALAGWMGSFVTHDWALPDFVPLALVHAFAQGVTFLAIVVFSVANVSPARATAFSAYLQVVRLDGTELSRAVMTTWLRVREQVHSHLLGLHVATGDGQPGHVLAGLRRPFEALGGSAGAAEAAALQRLADLVRREAQVMAYADGFWLTFWAAIAGLLLVCLLRAPPPGPMTPPARG